MMPRWNDVLEVNTSLLYGAFYVYGHSVSCESAVKSKEMLENKVIQRLEVCRPRGLKSNIV